VLARPVAGTLFFAGEATCGGGHSSTIEGALRSGLRAAGEILKSMEEA
jgi:monoamine oxidase